MAAQLSAGLLVARRGGAGHEFLLAHPGGPFWSRRDAGAWSIPKGLVEPGEDVFAAALREFGEETGLGVDGDFVALSPLKQKGGKTVHGWLVQADLDLAAFRSNSFQMQWPPGSGRTALFPEIDRLGYWPTLDALALILSGQAGFIHEALVRLT